MKDWLSKRANSASSTMGLRFENIQQSSVRQLANLEPTPPKHEMMYDFDRPILQTENPEKLKLLLGIDEMKTMK